MDLMLNSEEEQIVDTARALLSNKLPVDYLRWQNGAAAAADRAMLSTFCDMGWLAMGLPEDVGGFGFGATEEALLFREAGRSLVGLQLFAGVVAARITALAGEADISAAIVRGESCAGFAIPAHDQGAYLIDADTADHIVFVSDNDLCVLPASAFSLRNPVRAVDETVVIERAALDTSVAGIMGDAAALSHLSLLIAAQLSGSAEAVRDLTVAHASERAQFGQKIGTFQAVSHPIADMAVRCEAALSQMKVAAIAMRDGSAAVSFQVTAARVIAAEAAMTNAQVSVQLHGGMGFTAEYPIHFHLKRAHLLDQIGGTMAQQLDKFFEEPVPDDA